MEPNDLTSVLMLEAGLMSYVPQSFALGSAQLRIFFPSKSLRPCQLRACIGLYEHTGAAGFWDSLLRELKSFGSALCVSFIFR